MARLCEQGSLAQADFVLGQTVFIGGSIEAVKVGEGLAFDGAPTLSDVHTKVEGVAYDSLPPITEGLIIEDAAEAPGGDVAPASEQLVITNV